MLRVSSIAATAALMLFASQSPALAATPVTATVQPLDEPRLAVAREVVTIAWPPEQREAMMHKLMTTMMLQFKAGVQLEIITDPGLKKIMEDYFDSIPKLLQPSVSDFLPKQMDAIARAYARKFTLGELQDVRTFAQTPSGSRFLHESMDVMSDPDVAAVNTAYFKDITALSQTVVADLKTKIETYLKDHPEARPKA